MITFEYRNNFYTITCSYADTYIINDLLSGYVLKNGLYVPTAFFDGVKYVLKGDNYNNFVIKSSWEGNGFLRANDLYYNIYGQLADFSKIMSTNYIGIQDVSKQTYITGLSSINLELRENDIISCDNFDITLKNNFSYTWDPGSNTIILLSNQSEDI